MKKTFFICCTAIVFAFVHALPCFAASTLTISSSGGGSFTLQGTGIEKAAAFEITVSYDKTTLANPSVAQGTLVSGALMAVNTNIPGTIRIAFVTTNPVSGSGQIATLSFDTSGGSSGKILSLNAKLADISGRQLAAAAQVVDSSATSASGSSQQDQTSTDATTGSTDVSSGSGDSKQQTQRSIAGGAVIIPAAEATGQQEQKPAEPSEDENKKKSAETLDYQDQIAHAPKTDPQSDITPEAHVRKVHAHSSVLDRFREFKGTISIDKYLSFFEQDAFLGFRQEPPVALSNGKTGVKLTFISIPGDRSSSEAALAGGRLISLARDPDYSNTWTAEIQPARGEFSASLSIPQGAIIVLYPLTVAPEVNIDLDKSGSVTKADFDLFLSDRGSLKAPRFDLNGDRKLDYIDNYIFTANYIAALRNKSKQP